MKRATECSLERQLLEITLSPSHIHHKGGLGNLLHRQMLHYHVG